MTKCLFNGIVERLKPLFVLIILRGRGEGGEGARILEAQVHELLRASVETSTRPTPPPSTMKHIQAVVLPECVSCLYRIDCMTGSTRGASEGELSSIVRFLQRHMIIVVFVGQEVVRVLLRGTEL